MYNCLWNSGLAISDYITRNRIFTDRKFVKMSARLWVLKKALEYIHMTTKTKPIDDLLVKVSPDLVEKYEKINLPEGQTLRQVNEEYLGMKDRGVLPFRVLTSILIMMIVGIVSTFVLEGVFGTPKTISWVTMLPALVLIVLFLGPIRGKAIRENERLKVLVPILKEFREVVEALDNPVCHSEGILSVEFIRNVLIIYAVKLLESERAFDNVRFLPERRPIEIMLCGDSYQKYQEHLRGAFMVASKKFGLEFSRSDIFGEATNYLARRT